MRDQPIPPATTTDAAAATAETELQGFAEARAALGFARELDPALIAAFDAGVELIHLAIKNGVYSLGSVEPETEANWDRADWGAARWSGVSLKKLRHAARLFLIRAAELAAAGNLPFALTAADRAGRYFAELRAHQTAAGKA